MADQITDNRTSSIGKAMSDAFDGDPGASATWNRALTDDEIETVHNAMTATPFDPTNLDLAAPRTLMWRDEDETVRRITRVRDKVRELLVWWTRDDDYPGDDPDGGWTVDRIEAVDG